MHLTFWTAGKRCPAGHTAGWSHGCGCRRAPGRCPRNRRCPRRAAACAVPGRRSGRPGRCRIRRWGDYPWVRHRPFHCKSNKAVDELGQGSAFVLHQFRIHTNRGKAGKGVDLVDQHPAGAPLHEKVAPGQALASPQRCRPWLRSLSLRPVSLPTAGRDQGFADAVLVLVIIGIELGAGQDLAGAGGHGGLRADHGAFHFLAVYKRTRRPPCGRSAGPT